MAERSGGDLLHGHLRARQPDGVVIGFKIADQRRDPVIGPKKGEGFLKESRLAGAGAGGQAHHENSAVLKALAELAGDNIVLLENLLPDFYDPRWGHAAPPIPLFPRATTSSSRPWIISDSGVSQTGQMNHCIEVEGAVGERIGAIRDDRDFFDDQRALSRIGSFAGQAEGGFERRFHDSGERAQFEMNRV